MEIRRVELRLFPCKRNVQPLTLYPQNPRKRNQQHLGFAPRRGTAPRSMGLEAITSL